MIGKARSSSVLSLGILVLALVGCGNDVTGVRNNDFSARESFRVDLDPAGRSELVLEANSGDIFVTGTSGNSLIIQGERRVESDSQADADARLLGLQVEVTELGDRVSVRTDQPNDTRGRNYIVDYEILVPEDFEVDVTCVNGAVSVESLRGPVSVSAVNGVVSAEDVEASDVRLQVVNGIVDASIALPPGGAADMSTVNGNINLRIPSGTSAELDATVVNGIVTLTNFPLANLTVAPRSG